MSKFFNNLNPKSISLKLSTSYDEKKNEKVDMKDNNQGQQENNFWASYSDVFATIAIVFLTLFLFALIKSGISSLETQLVKKAHEAELKGNISQNDLKKSEERKEKFEKSINQIGKYQNVIDDKIKEINSFATKLQDNKKVMQEIINDQNKKDAIVNKLKTQLEINEAKIKRFSSENEKYKIDLALKEQELIKSKKDFLGQKEELEKKQANLNNQKTIAKDRINKLETTVENQKNDNSALSKEIASAKEKLAKLDISLSENRAKTLELENIKTTMENELQELKSKSVKLDDYSKDLNANNKFLTEEYNKSKEQINNLKEQLSSAQAEYKSNLSQAINSKNIEIDNLKMNLAGTKSEMKNKLSETLNQKNSEISNLKSELDKLKLISGKQSNELNRLQKDYEGQKEQIVDLKEGITKIHDGLRAKIAKDLEKKFKEANLNVKVDPRTGNVTLLMGQNFLFKRGSSQLSNKAKETLKKMIPIYANVLFSDSSIKEHINSLNIEGHASPSFNKRYTDPRTKINLAYEHNLKLSGKRAQSIISYVFSNQIGDYEHKIDMRMLTRSVGYGFTRPIPLRSTFLSREPASLIGNCGPFDCYKSQRVEMSFTLKDDKESIEKILKLKDKTGRKL